MKKVLLLLILAECASFSAYSQKIVKVDIVHLKADSIVTGQIIDSIPGVSITFKTLHKEYLFIPLDKIKEITSGIYIKSHERLVPMLSDSLATINHTSYWFWLQGGGRLGIGDTHSERAQIDMVNGFQTQSQFRLGIGIGARSFGDEDVFLVPVYLHLQTALSERKVTPMAAIGAGIVSNPKFDWKIGGPFLRADFGIQFELEAESFFTLSIGFEQMNFFTQRLFHTDFNTVNFFTLNAGIML